MSHVSVNRDGEVCSDEEIEIDGGSFEGATLNRCVLVYRGGGAPNLRGARIVDCQWAFRDAAARSVAMLEIIRLGWPEHAEELLAQARGRIVQRAGN